MTNQTELAPNRAGSDDAVSSENDASESYLSGPQISKAESK